MYVLTVFLGIIFLLVLGALGRGVFLLLPKPWQRLPSDQPVRRIAIVCTGLLIVTSPYLLFKAYELHTALAKIPRPLHVAWIEYRLEKSFGGIGFPSDNETGFIVYRLSASSTQWARSRGRGLG